MSCKGIESETWFIDRFRYVKHESVEAYIHARDGGDRALLWVVGGSCHGVLRCLLCLQYAIRVRESSTHSHLMGNVVGFTTVL